MPKASRCSCQLSGKSYMSLVSAKVSGALPAIIAVIIYGARFTSDNVRATLERSDLRCCASSITDENFPDSNAATRLFGICQFSSITEKKFVLFVNSLRYNVRVNCISPAAIMTPMVKESNPPDSTFDENSFLNLRTPLRRYGTPEEIAEIACFLASDKASYLNGAVFAADGGITINDDLSYPDKN